MLISSKCLLEEILNEARHANIRVHIVLLHLKKRLPSQLPYFPITNRLPKIRMFRPSLPKPILLFLISNPNHLSLIKLFLNIFNYNLIYICEEFLMSCPMFNGLRGGLGLGVVRLEWVDADLGG